MCVWVLEPGGIYIFITSLATVDTLIWGVSKRYKRNGPISRCVGVFKLRESYWTFDKKKWKFQLLAMLIRILIRLKHVKDREE